MYAFVSEDISKGLLKKLQSKYKVIKIQADPRVYSSIASHPDIRILPIEDQLFIERQTFDELSSYGFFQKEALKKMHILDVGLSPHYPDTVILNGKYKDNVFIHHEKYTHPVVGTYLNEKNIPRLHTKQGYTGCSLLLLNHLSGITSDPGLYKTLSQKGMQILKIRQGSIELKDKEYGFIGGASGVEGKEVFFNGDISRHPDYEAMREFIEDRGYTIIDNPEIGLTDIGSILFWKGSQ